MVDFLLNGFGLRLNEYIKTPPACQGKTPAASVPEASFIAFMLVQSFYYGNLKFQRRIHLTLIGLANELHLGLVVMDLPAPWVSSRGG